MKLTEVQLSVEMEDFFRYTDIGVSVLFVINFIKGIIVSERKGAFFSNPLNYFDLLASIPTLIGFADTSELRLLRLLTASKGINWNNYADVFKFSNSVVQKISHIFVIFLSLKLIIIAFNLDLNMTNDSELKTLLTILGFSLGIILSRQIGSAYGKYSAVNEILFKLRGRVLFMAAVFDENKCTNRQSLIVWVKTFLDLFSASTTNNEAFEKAQQSIYREITKIEGVSGVISQEFSIMCADMAYCLGVSRGRIPAAYSVLTHQAILLYLLALTVFIPGIIGIVTITLAVHLLYGLYFISKDFDSIIGGEEYTLISVRIDPLEDFIKES